MSELLAPRARDPATAEVESCLRSFAESLGMACQEPAARVPPDSMLARDQTGQVWLFRFYCAAAQRGTALQERCEQLGSLRHVALPRFGGCKVMTGSPTGVVIWREYVPGISLGEVLRRRGALSQAEISCLVTTVGGALRVMHEKGLVHGDISAGNVVVTPGGCPVLIDLCGGMEHEGGELGTVPWVSAQRLAGGAPSPTEDTHALRALAAWCAQPPTEQSDCAQDLGYGVPAEAVVARGVRNDPATASGERDELGALIRHYEGAQEDLIGYPLCPVHDRFPQCMIPPGDECACDRFGVPCESTLQAPLRQGWRALGAYLRGYLSPLRATGRSRGKVAEAVRSASARPAPRRSRGREASARLAQSPALPRRRVAPRCRRRRRYLAVMLGCAVVVGVMLVAAGLRQHSLGMVMTSAAPLTASHSQRTPGNEFTPVPDSHTALDSQRRAGHEASIGATELAQEVLGEAKRLVRARDQALMSASEQGLKSLTVPGSPAAVADEKLMAQLRERGERIEGLHTELVNVQATACPQGHCVAWPQAQAVRVRLSTGPYRRTAADGTRIDVPQGPESELIFILVPHPWRVAEILSAAHDEG